MLIRTMTLVSLTPQIWIQIPVQAHRKRGFKRRHHQLSTLVTLASALVAILLVDVSHRIRGKQQREVREGCLSQPHTINTGGGQVKGVTYLRAGICH